MYFLQKDTRRNSKYRKKLNFKDIVEIIVGNNRELFVKSGKLEPELKKCNIIIVGLPEDENEEVLD